MGLYYLSTYLPAHPGLTLLCTAIEWGPRSMEQRCFQQWCELATVYLMCSARRFLYIPDLAMADKITDTS